MTVVIDRPALAPFVPATTEAVLDLVRACSSVSLQRRFFLPVALDPDDVFARYHRYLLAGPPAGVATLATPAGAPVGLLNLVVVDEGVVEASLLVADAWQRRGVATGLLTHELRRPAWAGWTVRATVQPDNRAIRHLLRNPRWGRFRVTGTDPSQLDVEIVLPGTAAPPTQTAADDGAG
jgi:GNAT superfamily N-acetyltransferase